MSRTSTDSMDQEPVKPAPEKPDHHECLQILSVVLDDEATPQEKAIFKKHLQNCMPYFEIYSVDKTIRALIKENCKDKKLSEKMKDDIRKRVFNIPE